MTGSNGLASELVTFVRALEASGSQVSADGALAAAEAWSALDEHDYETTRVALRSALVTRKADRDRFDRLFDIFWIRIHGGTDIEYPSSRNSSTQRDGSEFDPRQKPREERSREEGETENSEASRSIGHAGSRTAETDGTREEVTLSQFSPTGRSEPMSAPILIDPDRQLTRLVKEFVDLLSTQRGRRWKHDPDGRSVDGTRALRQSLGTGGVVVPLPRREPRLDRAEAVVLVDVSRSVLDAIDRTFLLRFVRALYIYLHSARVFFFDTDLREVTDAFAAPTLAEAIEALERAETVWGGGTRIGESLMAVRDDSPEAIDWKTSVIIVSDGLERGNVDELEETMVWFSRSAGDILWLNPLAASTDYRPAARGMEAAFPYIDGFYGFTGLDDFAQIVDDLRRYGPDRTLVTSRKQK